MHTFHGERPGVKSEIITKTGNNVSIEVRDGIMCFLDTFLLQLLVGQLFSWPRDQLHLRGF